MIVKRLPLCECSDYFLNGWSDDYNVPRWQCYVIIARLVKWLSTTAELLGASSCDELTQSPYHLDIPQLY